MGAGDDTAPRFTQKPSLKQEDNGNKLVFQCALEASPKPDISWFRGTTPLAPSDRIKMRVDSAGGNTYNVLMDITGVTQADGGSYKVVAKNKLGEVSASINLNFNPAGQKQQDGIAPNFTQKPVIKQEDGGKKLRFECLLTADPAPQITWFRDSTQLNPGGRISMRTDPKGNKEFSIILEIANVSPQDAGSYRVTAKNDLGESNATIGLNFDAGQQLKQPQGAGPNFIQKPQIKQEQNKIVFECKLTADPKPTITWLQGNKPLTAGGRFKTSHVVDKNTHTISLEITDVGIQDGGEYKVLAKNNFGEATATITLNLEGKKPQIPSGKAPHFLQKPTIKQQANLLVMTCNLESKPDPKIKWFRETQEIKDGGRYIVKLENDPKTPDGFVATLQIKDPKPDDGGAYKCTATNEMGESNANITLNFAGAQPVKPGGKAPTFTEKPKVNQEAGGKNLVVECKCTANPKPDITWYKDNQILKETNRVKTRLTSKGDDYVLNLDILNFTKEDGGVYKVTAKNENGEGTANITINLEGAKPQPKPEEKKVEKKEEEKKVEEKKEEEKPKIAAGPVLKEPIIQLENNGQILVIKFVVSAKGKPTATWTANGIPVKSAGKYYLGVQPNKQSPGDYFVTMELKAPSDRDSGVYKANIKTPEGDVVAEAKINIRELLAAARGEPPKFTQKIAPKTVLDGEPVEFVAKVTGTEPIQTKWMKDRNVINNSDIYKMVYDKGTAKLTISECFPEDAGNYTVEAKNQHGMASCMASLTVKDNPKLAEPVEEKVEKKDAKKAESAPEEKKKPEVKKKPEEKKPEEKKPEEKKPEEKKPEEKKPEEKKPEEKKPEEKKPEEKKPEEKKPKPEEKKPEEKKPEKKEEPAPEEKKEPKGKKPEPPKPKEPEGKPKDKVKSKDEPKPKPEEKPADKAKPKEEAKPKDVPKPKEPEEKPKGAAKPKEEPKAEPKPKEEAKPKAPETKPKEETKPKDVPKPKEKSPEPKKEPPKTQEPEAKPKPEEKKPAEKKPEEGLKPKEETRELSPESKGKAKPRTPSIVVLEDGAEELRVEEEAPREGRRVSVVKTKVPEQQKVEGPTHKIKDKPANQSLVEGEPLRVKIACDVLPDLPPPVIKFYRANREIREDSRTNFGMKDNQALMQIKKTRFTDEAKYTLTLEQEGVVVDKVTWSVFIKDPKDSAMDFRSLLKHREGDKKKDEDEDIDWGMLKPDPPPNSVEKKRRLSQIELTKMALKKVESDSEEERTSSRRQSIDETSKLDIPVKKVSVEKLEAMDQQQRRASMQGRRLSLVEVIPDWPSLKTPERQVEVLDISSPDTVVFIIHD